MQPLAPSDSRSALPLDNEEFKDSSSKIPRDSSWDLERSTSAHVVPASEHSAPLHRNLKARHITMIAIGGIIGPGLLVGSGNALATAGPAGSLIAFAATGAIVFFVMQSLGEMATWAPVSGSFTSYAGRYVDPALSFALGYQYFYLWITVLSNEYNTVSLLIWYWPSARVVPEGAYIAIFWLLILSFAFLGVQAFGELEFWLTLIKIVAIGLFFIVAIIINTGGIGGDYIGFRYWGNPGSFADGINGVAKIFVVAGTLYAGCESIGVVSGESANPAKDVPRAIRQVFFRILFFYLGTVFLTGLVIPYTEPQLLNAASKAAASPFTIALSSAGIAAGAQVMNVIIIITVISAGNSSLYLCARILMNLAREGRAPRFLGITNKRGVPWPALLVSNTFGFLSLLKYAKGSGSGKVFSYLMNLSGVSTFIVWAVIILCQIRFRRAFAAQNRDASAELAFKALWYPYGAYSALAACVFLIFFQGYTTLKPFQTTEFVVAYLLVPVFVVSYFGWKVYHQTSIVKLVDIDLDSDRRQVEKDRRDQGIVERELKHEEDKRRRQSEQSGGRGVLNKIGRWAKAIFVS